MTEHSSTLPAPGGPRPLRLPPTYASLVGLIAAVTLVRLAFIAWGPLTLAEDEAHYWEWSRYLDWSYYSKGPGVAWAIWLSVSILGDTELAVRLPALLASAIGAYACARLAIDAFGGVRAGIAAAAVWLAAPAFQIVSVLMTIDGPMLACWALGTWAGWHAIRGGRTAWLALGATLAIGFLFKYTAVLLLPGIAIAAMLDRTAKIRTPWMLLGLAVALLGVLPIAIWNASHDWATVRHLLGHLGVAGGDQPTTTAEAEGASYSPLWTLEMIGYLFAIGGPAFALGITGALHARRNLMGRSIGAVTYCIATAAPVLLLYFVVSFFTRIEANWPMAGLVGFVPIAGWAAVRALARPDIGLKVAWRATVFTALLGIGALLAIAGTGLTKSDLPLIPLQRATGLDTLAESTQAKLDELEQETGLAGFVMAIHYGRASQLSFALDTHPTVFGVSSHFGGGRRTQYDLWPHTDLTRPEANEPLLGRPAVLFDGALADWRRVFDRVVEIESLPGESKPHRQTFLGYGFRGLANNPEP